MRVHRLLIPVATICCTLLVATTAQAASGSFKVSVSGTQSYSWSLDGVTNTCEVKRGAGSGTSKFSFKSPRSAPFFISTSSGITGSLNASAKGNRSGNFSVTTVTPCPGFEPGLPFIDDASGCGDYKYKLRMDFKQQGAFQYVTGPSQTYPAGVCPSPIKSSLFLSTDLTQCGDGNDLHKRSWGVSGAAGLLASKISLSIKKLLKTRKGKSKSITGKAAVECKPASSAYSNPVNIRAGLKYTLTFKRTS
ncbi:MAG: hypothetical protein ACSLFF_08155 [Solirubrobacterales bacterium]